ncbi:MAG: potassium channel family protein [Bacteroidota bacterium]
MLERLYQNRFELFLSSQLAILFGSLIVPSVFFETVFDPILFLVNLMVGILLISKSRKLMWFSILLLGFTSIIFLVSTFSESDSKQLGFLRMTGYFLFYLVVSYEILKQVWYATEVSKNVIFGLASGYISLGLIGFFICLSIELAFPGSFQGLLLDMQAETGLMAEQLLYFSFITLMTIGYGDILPVTDLSQKAAILIGLMGQFYLVIFTAVIVGKFIQQKD